MKTKKNKKNHCRQFKLTAILALLLPLAGMAQDLQVCAGKGYVLASKEDATSIDGSLTYTWYESVDGGSYMPMPDSNEASTSIPKGRAAGTYTYMRMAASDACSGVFSNAFTVVVKPAPSIQLTSGTASQTVDQNTDITTVVYTASNATDISGSGFPEGVTGYAEGLTYTISGTPTAAGTFDYTVTAANSNGCPEASASGTIQVDTKTPNLKVEFGITAEGSEGVTEVFQAVSNYIRSGGLSSGENKIALGDWIALEDGLEVEAYFNAGAINATNTELGEGKGMLLRLIVVGINSFSTVTENDYEMPPHVVFQFQNIPGTQKMGRDNAEGGYWGSIMPAYMEKFLQGLVYAGVPQDVLWGASRYMGARYSSNNKSNPSDVSDRLWLPTKWELYGEDDANGFEETKDNQARLEYYKDHSERLIKYNAQGQPTAYWTASQGADDSKLQFFFVSADGEIQVDGNSANYDALLGVAPAFCVFGGEEE